MKDLTPSQREYVSGMRLCCNCRQFRDWTDKQGGCPNCGSGRSIPMPKDIDPVFVRDWVRRMCTSGKSINFTEYDTIPTTWHERQLMYPYLSTEALVQVIEKRYLPNCHKSNRKVTTYEEVLIFTLVPILLQRLDNLSGSTEYLT